MRIYVREKGNKCMKNKIIINNIKLKKYDDMYYVSKSGDIYSTFSKKFLKHYIDKDGYHRVDIHKKHMKIHKLVYLTWLGEIPIGYQINHKDDDKNNNHISNLYLGNQKDNIKDQFKNEHRVGNMFYLLLYDSNVDAVINFCPSQDFIKYSGHPNKNGSLKKMFKKNWFKERYYIIEYKKIKSLKDIERVTTKCIEYNRSIG